MLRAVGWLCVIALGIAAHFFDSELLRGACALCVLGVIAITAPASLRISLAVLGIVAAVILIACGSGRLFDALPALIAAFVGWLFARTLARGRTPLIARAIAAIDGPQWLDDAKIARYARTLTRVWSVFQFALATIAAVAISEKSNLPPPRVFGAIVPIAVAILFVAEFAVRPFLLPQAPRMSFWQFARRIVVVWPSLLDDGMMARIDESQ